MKDSGTRQTFDSGMVRDTDEGKIDYLGVRFGPMYERWAAHVTAGRKKYPDSQLGTPNWTLAAGDPEYLRGKQSAARHFEQWLAGETDEDHAAAVFFNINLTEYVKAQPVVSGPTEEQLCAEDDLQYFRDRVAQLTAENDKLRSERGMIHFQPFPVDL